jgi:hypothetical protein
MTQQPPVVPERVYIQPRRAETLSEQLLDGGIWRYEGGPDSIPYARVHPVDDARVEEIRKRNDARKKFYNAGNALLVATTGDVDYLLSLLPQLSCSEAEDGFANKYFTFGPCFHSMVKPDCPSCCQGHAARMEYQLSKLEASMALPIKERVEAIIRESVSNWFQSWKTQSTVITPASTAAPVVEAAEVESACWPFSTPHPNCASCEPETSTPTAQVPDHMFTQTEDGGCGLCDLDKAVHPGQRRDHVPSTVTPGEAARETAQALQEAGLLHSGEAQEELGGDPLDLEQQLQEVAAVISRYFPPTEATQAGVENDLITRKVAVEIAEARLKDVPDTVDLEDDRNLFAAGYLAAAGSIKAALQRTTAVPAEAGEVEREVIQANRLWRIWLWNELQIDVRLSDDAARNEAVKQLADARTNTISECIEKLSTLPALPFDAVPYIRRDDAIAVLESLAQEEKEDGPSAAQPLGPTT